MSWIFFVLFLFACFFFLSDLSEIMANSRSYKKLLYAWEGWHNESGAPLREDYEKFVKLSNKASRADGENLTFRKAAADEYFCQSQGRFD